MDKEFLSRDKNINSTSEDKEPKKTSSDDINAINKALTGDSATKAASSTSAQNNTSSNNEIIYF